VELGAELEVKLVTIALDELLLSEEELTTELDVRVVTIGDAIDEMPEPVVISLGEEVDAETEIESPMEVVPDAVEKELGLPSKIVAVALVGIEKLRPGYPYP
jgi:hypothetical protein